MKQKLYPRTNPQLLADYTSSAKERGIKVITRRWRGLLPGMAAAPHFSPWCACPIPTQKRGLSQQLSNAKGVAVGTLAIGEAGAANAGLLAAQILQHER